MVSDSAWLMCGGTVTVNCAVYAAVVLWYFVFGDRSHQTIRNRTNIHRSTSCTATRSDPLLAALEANSKWMCGRALLMPTISSRFR